MNRVEPLLDWAFSQPEKPAVVTEQGSYSFGELAEGIKRAAARLASDVRRGSRVGLFVGNTPNFILYEYAALYLGAAVTPINRLLTEHEVRAISDRLGLDVVVTDEGSLDLEPTTVVSVRGEWDVPHRPIPRPYEEMSLEDPALVLQTSGTTGTPKGVVLTYKNLTQNYDSSYRWIGVTGKDVILQALPLYNTYGLNQGINMMAMTGATMRLFPKFSISDITKSMDEYESVFLPTVPTMISRFREAGNTVRGPKDLKVGIGAAPVARAVAEDAWEVFPDAFLCLGYGLTEATAIVAYNHIGSLDKVGEANLESVGKPVTGVNVKIGEPDEDDEGDVGEILVAGDNVFSSYSGTDAERPVDGEWLRTGDLGKLEDGWLYVVDRKRDLIIRGGQNVYPGEVERTLYAHPSVLEAAVVGRPDKDLGEVPVAFVTRVPRTDVSEDDLRAFCAERLARVKVPEAFVVLPELPKGPTGKILKSDLKRQLRPA